MAFDINQVLVVGRLTRDPELSYTPSNNTPLCKFAVANNSGKPDDPNGVSYFDIVVWNKLAEVCNQYIKKGSQVVVSGRLQQRRFQDSQGQNRNRVEIIANNVQFVGAKADSTGGGTYSAPSPSYSDQSGGNKYGAKTHQAPPSSSPDPFDNIDFNSPDEEEIPF